MLRFMVFAGRRTTLRPGALVDIKGITSLPVPVLATAFWHARAYSLYRSLGKRVSNLSYPGFAFEIQSPDIRGCIPATWMFSTHCRRILRHRFPSSAAISGARK
jgi:hypothetical protein